MQGPTPTQAATPDPLTASSGLTYRGSPITPTPYTGGFPSDEDDGLEPSSDTFTAPSKSTGQIALKGVKPRVVRVIFVPPTLVTDTRTIFYVVHHKGRTECTATMPSTVCGHHQCGNLNQVPSSPFK